jgi:ADP-L-glycero-D-manno-heptose 6-epimerase
MRVFITGSDGFIGKNLLKRIPLDWEIGIFDIRNNPTTRPSNLQYDIASSDWVIHLGAISSTTETNIQKLMDWNLAWSIELFEQCEKHNTNLQFASSASVYGQRDHTPFKEDDPVSPLNNYAVSKFLFEQYLNTRKTSITWHALRFFNVYGPYEEHKGNQASPYTQFKNQAITSGSIKVFEGSQDVYRDFIDVSEVNNIQLQMLNIRESGVWNVGTGKPKSFLQVAEEVSAVYNVPIVEIPFPEHLKLHYQYYTCADTTKLTATLG